MTTLDLSTVQRSLRVIQSCRNFAQLKVAGNYAAMALHAAYYDSENPLPPTLTVLFRDKIHEALDAQREQIRALGPPRIVRHQRRKAAAC